MRVAQAVIDLPALRHNLQRARAAAPDTRVLAAIKADGYGHGQVAVARNLADGADALGVACLKEALALREAGIDTAIVLLEGFFHPDELPAIVEHGLEMVVHHPFQLEALDGLRPGRPIPVWLKVDTGMHRLGFPPAQAARVWQWLGERPAVVAPVGLLTHLANADERDDPTTGAQLARFDAALAGCPGAQRSIANSAGVLGWPESHADWVRPGIMLYGCSPFPGRIGPDEALRPVMTLRSALMAVNRLEAGDRVGYGGTWTAPEPMPVGVVAVGYGDGYPRHAPNGTPVLVNGRRVPLVGRVSMDMVTVDLRGQPDARVGDPVVLWGEGLPVEEVAGAAGTISYELICGVTQRVERTMVEG